MLKILDSNFISNLFVQPLVCPLYLEVFTWSYEMIQFHTV